MSTLLGPGRRRVRTVRREAPETLTLLLAGLLLALLVLAWGMAWKGALSLLWTGVVLHQTGNVSYLLPAASCVLGALIGVPLLRGALAPAARLHAHGLLSGLALTLGTVHGAFSLVGPEHLSVGAALLPGAAAVLTLPLAAGSVSLWLLLIVWGSWTLRRPLGLKAARLLHLLAYPAFVAATLHGVWLGRGPGPLYSLSSLLVALALTARLLALWRRQAAS